MRKRRAEVVLLVVFSLPLLMALGLLAWRSTLRMPITYNEGWNAIGAAAILTGTPLYHPPCSLLTNNYPPLSFYIIASLTRVTGDAIMTGRLVSGLALMSLLVSIFAIIRRAGGDAVAGFGGVMTLTASLLLGAFFYIGMDDPQLLAHAIEIGSVLPLIRSPSNKNVVISALAIGIALFVKHDLLGLPMAIALWFLFQNRRQGILFIAVLALIGCCGLSLCVAIFGRDFLTSLSEPRVWLLVRSYQKTAHLIQFLLVPLIIVALAMVDPLRDRIGILFATYVVTSLVVGMIGAAGEGVGISGFFDVIIATALTCGHFLGRMNVNTSVRRLRPFAIGVIGLSFASTAWVNLDRRTITILPWIRSELAYASQTRDIVQRLKAVPDPVICQDLAICYWAGRRPVVDLFNHDQAVMTGACSERPFLKEIRAGAFSRILIRDPPMDRTGMTLAALTAVHSAYRQIPTHTPAVGVLYRPARRRDDVRKRRLGVSGLRPKRPQP